MSFQCSYIFCLKIIVLYLLLFAQFGNKAFASQKKCGDDLTEALASFCVNKFNGRFRRSLAQKNQKRNISAPPESLYSRLREILTKFEPESTQTNPDDYATANFIINKDNILIRKRKQVQVHAISNGVADECCSRPCAYEELIQYCS